MGEYTLAPDGTLADAEGNPFEVDGEPVKVTNALNQDGVDKVVKDRLARQAAKAEADLKVLKEQADQTPALQKLIEERESELGKARKDLEDATQNAQREVSQQLTAAQKKAEEALNQLKAERGAHIRTQVTNDILSKTGDRFINPSLDVVPKLLETHKREPVLDEQTGKPIPGKYSDVFEVTIYDEEGESRREFLPIVKALDALVVDPNYQHYVRPADIDGSGGGRYKMGERPKKKWNEMTKEEWSAEKARLGVKTVAPLLGGV